MLDLVTGNVAGPARGDEEHPVAVRIHPQRHVLLDLVRNLPEVVLGVVLVLVDAIHQLIRLGSLRWDSKPCRKRQRQPLVKKSPALGLPILELVDDPALLLGLGWFLGSLHPGLCVTLILRGEFVARLRLCLVPLALFYVAPAVYAYAFSFLIDMPDGYVVTYPSLGVDARFPTYPAQKSPKPPTVRLRDPIPDHSIPVRLLLRPRILRVL